MKHLKLFVLQLLVLFAYSSKAQGVDYKNYYHCINRIEIEIANRKIEQACNKYDSLFVLYPRVLDKDYYNYSICCSILGDTTKVVSLCKELLKTGYFTKESINKSFVYQNFHRSKLWLQLFNEDITKSITKEDSLFYSIRHDLFLSEQKNKDDFILFYSATYKSIIALFNLFISDERNLQLMFTGRKVEYISMMNHYYELFDHREGVTDSLKKLFFQGLQMEKYNLDSLYQIAVIRGYLKPNEYAESFDYSKQSKNILSPSISVFVFRDSNDLIILKPPKEIIEQADMNRAKFGLSSFEDMLQKAMSNNSIISNFPFDKFRYLLDSLETDNDYNMLSSPNNGAVFIRAFFSILENLKNQVRVSESNLYYSFLFEDVRIKYNPDSPKCDLKNGYEDFLVDHYLTLIEQGWKRIRLY